MSQPTYSTESAPVRMGPAQVAAAVAASKPARKAAPRKSDPAAPPLLGGVELTDPRLPGVTIRLELITPELAEFYLTKLPGEKAKIKQRGQSRKLVDRYAGDMAAEQWPFTGDPVRFNALGELVDGQHRLRGIVQAKTSEMMVVIYGLELEAFSVIDTGRARSFSDVLKSMGVSNVAMVGGITRCVFYWSRDNYGVPNVARRIDSLFTGVSASPGMLLDTFNALRPDIETAARRASALRASGVAPRTAPPAVIGFLYILFSRLDLDRCESFFHQLQVGPEKAGPEFPLAVLRDRLRRHLPDHVAGAPAWVWIHFFLTTWNRWLEAKSMTGGLRTPPDNAVSFLAKPIDPHAAERPADWEPIPRFATLTHREEKLG